MVKVSHALHQSIEPMGYLLQVLFRDFIALNTQESLDLMLG
jgi:hypothetical protein